MADFRVTVTFSSGSSRVLKITAPDEATIETQVNEGLQQNKIVKASNHEYVNPILIATMQVEEV